MSITEVLKAIPAGVRQTVYVLAFIGFLILSGINLFGHDWLQVALYVFTSLGFGTAAANVNRQE